MPPFIASILFTIGILGLFYLDRGYNAQVTKALWIPTAWVMITISRPVSMWLGMTPKGAIGTIYLEGSPIDRAVILALEVAALLVVINRIGPVGRILRKNWPILLFFLYAASSILWSDYPFVTFKHWIKGIGDVMMVLIVLTEPSVSDALNRLVTRAGFLLLPLSVLFGKYYPDAGSIFNHSWNREWTGVATQKNGLGELCAILGLGLLWRFRTTYNDREDPGRSRRLLALGTVLGMSAWLLWMCNSLTSICALIMGSIVILVSPRPRFRRRPALVHLVIVAMLSVAVFALFFQSSGALVKALGRSSTLSGRTVIWAAVLSVPVNRLVGAGYETFWVGPRMQEVWAGTGMDGMKVNEAHDGYTEMLVNLGWIGVTLLGFLIVGGYRNVAAELRNDPGFGGLRMAFLLNALIIGLTEAAFRVMSPMWIFFLMGSTAIPLAATVQGQDMGKDIQFRMDSDRQASSSTSEGVLARY